MWMVPTQRPGQGYGWMSWVTKQSFKSCPNKHISTIKSWLLCLGTLIILGPLMKQGCLKPCGFLGLAKMKLVKLMIFRSQTKCFKSTAMLHQKWLRGPYTCFMRMSGFCNRLCGNEKIKRSKEIHDDLDVNVVAYSNIGSTWNTRRMPMVSSDYLKGGESAIQSIVAHNIHENIGQIQQGGTSLFLFDHLTEQMDCNKCSKDESGLGQWTFLTLQGDGIQTRVVYS